MGGQIPAPHLKSAAAPGSGLRRSAGAAVVEASCLFIMPDPGEISAFDGECVTFRYRDYHDGNAQKLMELPAVEFLRRFLMHVVPKRFTRIRYYGFLSNRDRTANIEKARALIGSTRTLAPRAPAPDPGRCPQCGQGTMRTRAKIDPQRPRMWFDSS